MRTVSIPSRIADDPEAKAVLDALAWNSNLMALNEIPAAKDVTYSGTKSIEVNSDQEVSLFGDAKPPRGDQYYGTRDGKLGFHDLVLPSFVDYHGAESVQVTNDQIRLLHDKLLPGPRMYYGTGTRGIKAWLPLGGLFQAQVSTPSGGSHPLTGNYSLATPMQYDTDFFEVGPLNDRVFITQPGRYAVLSYFMLDVEITGGIGEYGSLAVSAGTPAWSCNGRTGLAGGFLIWTIAMPMTFVLDVTAATAPLALQWAFVVTISDPAVEWYSSGLFAVIRNR